MWTGGVIGPNSLENGEGAALTVDGNRCRAMLIDILATIGMMTDFQEL